MNMNIKLCLGTFLSLILEYKATKKVTNKTIVDRLMSFFDASFIVDDRTVSHYVGGTRNPSKVICNKAQYLVNNDSKPLVYLFSQSILPLLKNTDMLICDIKNLVSEDLSIPDREVVDLYNSIEKSKIKKASCDAASLLCGVLLYVLTKTDNVGMKEQVDLVNEYYPRNLIPTKINNEDIIQSKARRFCIEHEEELDLLILCQIAFFIDPTKRNGRRIYNDFKTEPITVQEQILYLKGVPKLDFSDSGWLSKSLTEFLSIAKKYHLSEIDLFYDGAKYLRNAYELFANYPITNHYQNIMPRIHPELVPPCFPEHMRSYCDLGDYISDYVHYGIRKGEDIIPPLDMLDSIVSLHDCPASVLSTWLCYFIIESCYELADCSFSVDNNELIQTQEDLYFLTVLQLYNFYTHPKNI